MGSSHHRPPPRVYTEIEVAALLSVSVRTVQRRIRSGKLRCIRDGAVVRFTQRHIDEYLRSSEATVAVEAPRERRVKVREGRPTAHPRAKGTEGLTPL